MQISICNYNVATVKLIYHKQKWTEIGILYWLELIREFLHQKNEEYDGNYEDTVSKKAKSNA